jgi:hypothetical protein
MTGYMLGGGNTAPSTMVTESRLRNNFLFGVRKFGLRTDQAFKKPKLKIVGYLFSVLITLEQILEYSYLYPAVRIFPQVISVFEIKISN